MRDFKISQPIFFKGNYLNSYKKVYIKLKKILPIDQLQKNKIIINIYIINYLLLFSVLHNLY